MQLVLQVVAVQSKHALPLMFEEALVHVSDVELILLITPFLYMVARQWKPCHLQVVKYSCLFRIWPSQIHKVPLVTNVACHMTQGKLTGCNAGLANRPSE